MRTIQTLFLGTILLFPGTLIAQEYTFSEPQTPDSAVRFNNENWHTLPHPKPASFNVHSDGSVTGTTTTNVPFRQYTIFDEKNVRVQRFEIQDHVHYIANGRIFYSDRELLTFISENLAS